MICKPFSGTMPLNPGTLNTCFRLGYNINKPCPDQMKCLANSGRTIEEAKRILYSRHNVDLGWCGTPSKKKAPTFIESKKGTRYRSKPLCSVEGCTKRSQKKGLCSAHYKAKYSISPSTEYEKSKIAKKILSEH